MHPDRLLPHRPPTSPRVPRSPRPLAPRIASRLRAVVAAMLLLPFAATASPVRSTGAGATVPAPPAAPADARVAELDAIVVTGVVPGPGLWRVERDGHVLWVLATVSPLPRRIEWSADEVEARIGESGVVLLAPGARIEAEGMFLGGIFLLPSLMKARNNPDKRTLADVLPPADYARWQSLKARYLGRDRGVEKRRPIVAAMELREAALEHHDLSLRSVVEDAVQRAARRADVPTKRAEVALVIDDAKAALKTFRASSLDDLACFRRTLDQVENDLGTLADRANAWSLGDVAALQGLQYTDAASACMDAVFGAGLAKQVGLADLPERIAAAWLADAEAAIATHPNSFAMLPLSRVTGPESWLVRLAAKGYTIHPPSAD